MDDNTENAFSIDWNSIGGLNVMRSSHHLQQISYCPTRDRFSTPTNWLWQIPSRYKYERNAPTSMRNPLYLHAMFVDSAAWMGAEQRRTNMKTPAEAPQCCIHGLPVNSSVQFVRGRWEHLFTRHEKQGCLQYFTVFSKIQREQCCIAGGWGYYAMVFMFSISDGSEGNTTPTVHSGRPSVSAVSDSLENIWLTCRPRSF